MTDKAAYIPTNPARIRTNDLVSALVQGGRDAVASPLYGLALSAPYVIGGLLLWWLDADMLTMTIVLSFGFPIIAPFIAVGFYEVSRRFERNQTLNFKDIMTVLLEERGRQIPWFGFALVVVLLFWSFFAHMAFALFLGHVSMVGISESWAGVLSTPQGMVMIAFQLFTGAVVAFLVFTMSLTTIPMVLDKEVDVITAMIHSFKSVIANSWVALIWAAIIAGVLATAMIPFFIGLFIALPVLGHASWHLYRRLTPDA